jgi:hypothetical protein
MTPEDFEHMDLQELLRKLTELEAKFRAPLEPTPLEPAPREESPAPRPAPGVRRDRQAFVQIALLCKRALELPPWRCRHQDEFLAIARLCKRALEREA